MIATLRSEAFRLVRRRMPWILLVILAATVLLLYTIMWLSAQSSQFTEAERADLIDSLGLASVLETGLGLTGLLGSLFVVILAASVAATEYAWGTIRTVLPRTAGRMAWIGAKLVVLVVFALAVVVTGVLVTVAAATVVTVVEGMERGVGAGFVADVALGIVRTWFTSLPYLALAFMVALLAKSSAAGISVGAAVLFLEGQILTLVGAIGGAFERLPEAFPSRNVEAILALNGGGEPARDLPGPWQATAVLLAYAVLFVAIAVWRFTRRDVTVG